MMNSGVWRDPTALSYSLDRFSICGSISKVLVKSLGIDVHNSSIFNAPFNRLLISLNLLF